MHCLEENGLLTFNNLCVPWNVKLFTFSFPLKKKTLKRYSLWLSTKTAQWKTSTPKKQSFGNLGDHRIWKSWYYKTLVYYLRVSEKWKAQLRIPAWKSQPAHLSITDAHREKHPNHGETLSLAYWSLAKKTSWTHCVSILSWWKKLHSELMAQRASLCSVWNPPQGAAQKKDEALPRLHERCRLSTLPRAQLWGRFCHPSDGETPWPHWGAQAGISVPHATSRGSPWKAKPDLLHSAVQQTDPENWKTKEGSNIKVNIQLKFSLKFHLKNQCFRHIPRITIAALFQRYGCSYPNSAVPPCFWKTINDHQKRE